MSEVYFPFFYESSTKRFHAVSGQGPLGFSAEELKEGLGQWSSKVDELVAAAEPKEGEAQQPPEQQEPQPGPAAPAAGIEEQRPAEG